MKTMTLAEAIGTSLKSNLFTGRVTSFDPIEECFILSGTSHLKLADGSHWKDDPVIMPFCKTLAEFGIAVQYSPAEQKMVDEAKLTFQVAKKSQDLLSTITAWLNRPGGR